ncbi:DUF499 domain-containing protein [Tropicimonas sp. TH_r6]|uniref:ATP-binding protein n=1 Tax=Tropicimonas sp. TH_r6 TaxID=3082085 RepID=UPI002955CCD4|nr:DUF499 domain-containing protein [Tropicimonas sp. TH_r6]MDV7143517.1 DUF499 domain-containing protein [Tropicimonas sp. TH_r6]
MRPVYEQCTPRADIISGTFNPELFTASLKQVMDSYAGRQVADTPYTDAKIFFGEATYPTSGMRDLFATVLRRVTGDTTASAITRLETGFGGGKTHSLIGLVHCAKRGQDIQHLVNPLFPDLPLLEPDEVCVIAIAGDVLSVNKRSGTALIPHTLWGELAMQVGGEGLYRELKGDVSSVAAPGDDFFRRVLGGRKAIVLIDELAQYVARFEAAHPGIGSTQVAAFLMALSTFARSVPGISVVISLASSTDAFAKQSENLGSELTRITGAEITPEEAAKRAALAVGETESVVARDALPIKPVPQNELSRVLARRLFSSIDPSAASEAAEAYAAIYASCPTDLPSEVKHAEYVDILRSSYPFHPTFLRFLNEKLASIETFQGTRGVLRVMTLAIRLIWEKQPYTPMIHVGHLDFSDRLMADEIVGSRLRAGDMQIVLNTDVGGPQSDSLASSRSRAQMRDKNNPLPSGISYHEMTWRTVLVNSLVGRSGGVASNLFGINEADAILSVTMPELPATAVKTALEAIQKNAYYLREQDGKYFASTDPTINRALNDIREGVNREDALKLILEASRKVITNQNGIFEVREDVTAPQDMAESPKRPSLGIVRVDAAKITIDDFIETVGVGQPRISQNHISLLIPNTVATDRDAEGMFAAQGAQRSLDHLVELAREVRAIEKLHSDPGAYGLTLRQLDDDFQSRRARARNDLNVASSKSYTRLVYPGPDGVAIREIRVAGGEGGAAIAEQVKEILRRDGEVIEADRATTMEIVRGLSQLFFSLGSETPSLQSIRDAFAQQRRWPILEEPGVLYRVISAGVEKGVWCLFRFLDSAADQPDEIYNADNPAPLTADLSLDGWSVIQVPKARARGWIKGEKPSEDKIREWTADVARQASETKVSDIVEKVREKSDAIEEADVLNVIPKVIGQDRYVVHDGSIGAKDKPDGFRDGVEATFRPAQADDVLMTRSEASKRGWLEQVSRRLEIEEEGMSPKTLIPLIKRLGRIAASGAKSNVDDFRIQSLRVPGGASIDLKIADATPESLKVLDELFETLMTVGRVDENTFASIEIEHPDDECALVAELKKGAE